MSHPDIITSSIWDEPGNTEKLTKLYFEGLSYAQIAAAIGQGVSREACIGKVGRLKLAPRDISHRRPDRVTRETVPLVTGKRGRAGNPGVPSVQSIKHRIEGREKIERARQEGKLSHFGQEPFRPGRLPTDEGVDVTDLIAFADRKINRECAWIPGSPIDGAMCCGKPVVEGTQWCREHHARVYPARN